jgi:restriction endonuclease S subunit
MKLKNIATVKTGLVLSRKKANHYDDEVTYQQLTLKSFDNSTFTSQNSLEYFSANSEINSKYLTQVGDIVVRLRAPNIAICIDEKSQNLIISSLMCVIRPIVKSDKNINNRFLAHYLNSKYSQKIFNIAVKGTTIPMIKTNDIADLEIILPQLSKQNKLVEIMDLAHKEQNLLNELLQKKQIFTKNILNTIIEKHQGGK